jgi:hypothetical protein
VTGCGKRMGGGLAPLKCGERTELRTELCIDCLPAQPVTDEPPKRTCNRHDDCDAADAKAKAAGQSFVDHCHDDCCEDCFGS